MSDTKRKSKKGRPLKYNTKFLKDLLNKFNKYIEKPSNDIKIPILAEFAYLNNIPRQQLYTFKEFSDAIKRCHDKKESLLEIYGLANIINPTMAIFSLKQLGWKDNRGLEIGGLKDTPPIRIVFIPHKKKKGNGKGNGNGRNNKT